jgi:hypothetical protein
VVKKHGEGFNYDKEPIDGQAVYDTEAEKHMDGEIDALFSLTL